MNFALSASKSFVSTPGTHALPARFRSTRRIKTTRGDWLKSFARDGTYPFEASRLKEVRETVDPKTKQRIFEFIDIHPSGELLGLRFNGCSLYATAKPYKAEDNSFTAYDRLIFWRDINRAAARPATRKRRDRDEFVG
jgi:hypothetical protein